MSWLNTIPLSSPWDNIVICNIIAISIVLSVIVIGVLIEKFEILQLRLLSNTFNAKIACIIVNRLTFVGTIVHEYAHAFFATIAGAKVTEIRCFDIGQGDQLGHCSFICRGSKLQQMIQLSLSACAPVIVGFLVNYILICVVLQLDMTIGWRIFVWYCIISITDHMNMSSVDIKNYAKGLVIVYPLLFAIVWLLKFLLTKTV